MAFKLPFNLPTRRILVIKTRAIGDSVILTGTLRVLREQRPFHTIDVIARNPGGHLLEGLSFVDRVICISEPKSKIDRLAYWFRLVRRLRAKRYDMVLVFHSSVRTAFFAKLLRTQIVVANNHDLKSKNWFSDAEVPNRGQVKSIIDRDLDVLRAIGIDSTPENAMPEIKLNASEIKWAEKKIKDVGHFNKDHLFVFFGIGASRETKRWSPEKFIELAAMLSEKKNAVFVMVTVPEDQPWMHDFNKLLDAKPDLKKCFIILKNISLRHTAAVLSKCRIYIGNDSGVKHIAVALGLPTYTFFGPELPVEWHPYPVDRHPYSFVSGLDCRTENGQHWCSISVCRKHGHQCMKNVEINSVYEKVVQSLENK